MSEQIAKEAGHRRKLAAIMFTDIVGYSAMSARNELDALNAISSYERITRPILAEHSGIEIKSLGDGSLAEFESAMDAVRCAIEIQRAMHEQNALAPEQQVKLRIGIHVGEVIHREGDVFGDGVNVAARLQPLAPPEGVCFSEDVWRLIRDKVPVQVVRLGAGELKNLGRPINVYRLRFPWDTTGVAADRAGLVMRRKVVRGSLLAALLASVAVVAALLARSLEAGNSADETRRPLLATRENSIVVLPFKNLSDDPKLQYWSDGLTEELIGALSTVPRLSVMGRETAWSFTGKATDAREICRQLEVSAALEGTVRKERDRLRISVRMTDGKTGLAIWSEKYDEKTEDVFRVQERIANAVTRRMKTPSPAVKEKVANANPLAYDAYLHGRAILRKGEVDRAAEAETLFKKAIELDPRFAKAYASLAEAHYWQSNVTVPPNVAMPKMREAAMKSVESDPNLADGYVMLGLVRSAYDWDWEAGRKAFEEALILSPNSALGHQYFGMFLADQGEFEAALQHLQTAIRLDPAATQTKGDYAFALYRARRFDDAVRFANKFEESKGGAAAVLGDCYLEGGRADLAEIRYKKRFALSHLHEALAHLVMAQAALGKKKEALASLHKLERKEVKDGFVTAYMLGIAHAAVGNLDEAFRHWERAFEDRSEQMIMLAVDPHMDNHRSDPRFKRLLKQMNLPDLPVPQRQRVVSAP